MIVMHDKNAVIGDGWKVTLSYHFTTIVHNDLCLTVGNDDDARRVQNKVKEVFGQSIYGYYYFAEDDLIKKIFAKCLLVRDRK